MIHYEADVAIDGHDGALVRGDALYHVEWLDARYVQSVSLVAMRVGFSYLGRRLCVQIAGEECIKTMEADLLERIESNPGDYTG